MTVTKEPSHIIFNEKGVWQGKDNEVNFKNVYRWTLDREKAVISLEHLRRGPEHPVFLCHFEAVGPRSLTSVHSHLCREDSYFCKIRYDKKFLVLNWRVIGPKKNEERDCYYF